MVTLTFDHDESLPDERWTTGVRLVLGEMELQGELMKGGAAIERDFAAAIAERTGTDADHDLYPLLVAAAVSAAIRVASEQWLRVDPPVPLPALLHEALGRLAAGLPTP